MLSSLSRVLIFFVFNSVLNACCALHVQYLSDVVASMIRSNFKLQQLHLNSHLAEVRGRKGNSQTVYLKSGLQVP